MIMKSQRVAPGLQSLPMLQNFNQLLLYRRDREQSLKIHTIVQSWIHSDTTYGRLQFQKQAIWQNQNWNSKCEGSVLSMKVLPMSSNLDVQRKCIRLHLSSKYTLFTLPLSSQHFLCMHLLGAHSPRKWDLGLHIPRKMGTQNPHFIGSPFSHHIAWCLIKTHFHFCPPNESIPPYLQ